MRHLYIFSVFVPIILIGAVFIGCGTTNTRRATEQLLVSDAVDHTVSKIDFRAMTGQTVFLSTDYLHNVKGVGFVNADYIVSSLRQQIVAAGCRLQDKRDDADYIIEARVGALGTDGHELTLGIPKSDGLSSAMSLLPSVPTLPTFPEIAFAKRQAQSGAAKIAVFAYHRETKEPVWQSGVSLANSDANDIWLFGAGPIQKGSIYRGTKFAGSKIKIPLLARRKPVEQVQPAVSYFDEKQFATPIPNLPNPDVQYANFEEPTEEPRQRTEAANLKPGQPSRLEPVPSK